MGLAKLFIAGVTMAVMTVFAPTVFASAQKGLNAFQRGKYEDALKFLNQLPNWVTRARFTCWGMCTLQGAASKKTRNWPPTIF